MNEIFRLKEISMAIEEIWQNNDKLGSWIEIIWLVQKQLDEIQEANYTGDVVLNEIADILIILIRYLNKLGIDPKKLIFHRLKTRHKGRVAEILAKYEQIWNDEHLPQCSHRCPKCHERCEGVEGHSGLHQDKHQHFWEGVTS